MKNSRLLTVIQVACLLSGAATAHPQPFGIESIHLDSHARPFLRVSDDGSSYFRVLGGQNILNIQETLAISLERTILTPRPATNRQYFYRVQRIPAAVPLDSDQDGMDDLWELEHGLDPLFSRDASQVPAGENRAWLQIYLAEKAALTLDYQYSAGHRSRVGNLVQDPISKAIYLSGSGQDNDGNWHALILKSSDHGLHWSTNAPVLDERNGGTPVVVADFFGNLYAIGSLRTDDFGREVTVLKSSDQGTNWLMMDRYLGDPNWGARPLLQAAAAACDRNGNVYFAGQAVGATFNWFVRKFSAASNSWTTTDVFRGSGHAVAPTAMVCDSKGGVFVAGTDALDAFYNGWRWVVRSSHDAGETWQSSYYRPFPNSGRPAAIAAVGDDNLFLAGNAFEANGTGHWIVRGSSDGGTTWRTLDDTLRASGLLPAAIAADSANRLHVAGSMVIENKSRSLVRQSSDGGATWLTIDEFQYADEHDTEPESILALPDGTILTAGTSGVFRDDSSYRWFVRRFPRPPE